MPPNNSDPRRQNPTQPQSSISPPSASSYAPFPAAQRAMQAAGAEEPASMTNEDGEIVRPMSQLAVAYTQYEVSLYTSGMDFDQIDQRLKHWRDQHANGASATEIMYGPMPEDSSESNQSQVTQQGTQAAPPQPQPIQQMSESTQIDRQPTPELTETAPNAPPQQEEQNLPAPKTSEDGELRVR